MPKKASKEQLIDWKERLERGMVIMDFLEKQIADVEEEHATIKAEMKGYGMLEEKKDEDTGSNK